VIRPEGPYSAGKGTASNVYAEAGIWSDALAAISESVEAAPNQPAFRKQQAALMAQVGLTEIQLP
jgi:Domain of Unknown Function (DUF928)